jgi:hypothetical protein
MEGNEQKNACEKRTEVKTRGIFDPAAMFETSTVFS